LKYLPRLEYNAQANVGYFTDAGTGINAFWWSDLTAAICHSEPFAPYHSVFDRFEICFKMNKAICLRMSNISFLKGITYSRLSGYNESNLLRELYLLVYYRDSYRV